MRVLIQTLIRNYSWLTMYEWWKRPFIFLPLCMSRSDCNGVTSLEPDYVHVSYGTKSLARKKKRDKCKSCINHRITLWIDQFFVTPPPFMTFFASHCERLSSVESFHRFDRELYYFSLLYCINKKGQRYGILLFELILTRDKFRLP